MQKREERKGREAAIDFTHLKERGERIVSARRPPQGTPVSTVCSSVNMIDLSVAIIKYTALKMAPAF